MISNHNGVKIVENRKQRKPFYLGLLIILIELIFVFLSWLIQKQLLWENIYIILGADLIAIGILISPKKLQNKLVVLINKYLKFIGIDHLNELYKIRSVFALVISLPFSFYILLNGVVKPTSPVLQFTIITVSATLGGLVLTSANNRRVNRRTHEKLIKVAQKMIVSAVFFIIIVSLLFMVDFMGGIDTHHWDFSVIGLTRGLSFWAAGIGFYLGVFLFLMGLLDLVVVLKDLRE